MSEQTRIKVIGVCLVVAIIWAGFNYKSSDSIPTSETPQTIQPLKAEISVSNQKNSFIDIEKYNSMSWGRSPFYLSSLESITMPNIVSSDNKALSWILSGIVLNKSSSTAIINKRPVKIGETIDKAIVTSIEKEKVIIKYNQKEITLTVSKG